MNICWTITITGMEERGMQSRIECMVTVDKAYRAEWRMNFSCSQYTGWCTKIRKLSYSFWKRHAHLSTTCIETTEFLWYDDSLVNHLVVYCGAQLKSCRAQAVFSSVRTVQLPVWPRIASYSTRNSNSMCDRARPAWNSCHGVLGVEHHSKRSRIGCCFA